MGSADGVHYLLEARLILSTSSGETMFSFC
jgi:hypothetical protein